MLYVITLSNYFAVSSCPFEDAGNSLETRKLEEIISTASNSIPENLQSWIAALVPTEEET
jgi:hypothetical protein